MLTGLYIKPEEDCQIIKFNNNNEEISKLIDGYMEVFPLKYYNNGRAIYLILNEDGKILQLTPNILLLKNNIPVDEIVGNVICIASDGSEFVSLDDAEINELKDILNKHYINM